MAIFLADTLTGVIEELTGMIYAGTKLGVIFLGFYYGTIGTILLIGSIGLFLKNNFCRYLAIGASSYFFILGFPLAIALFLCEEDIKKMFTER